MIFHTNGRSAGCVLRWRYLSRLLVILACAIPALTLSGCSFREGWQDDALSKVMTEEDYQKYIELRENGQLDADGRYISAELTAEPAPQPTGIHVTFAHNSYIEVEYFLDAKCTRPVNVKECYLRPGDCIYSSEPVCNHPVTDKYSFDCFRVYAYDEAGKKGDELFWGTEEGDDPNLVLCVPSGYEGTEISIEPMGKYEKRIIALEAYYVDSAKQRQRVSGTWIVNGEMVTGRTAEVNPVEPLAIDFSYKDICEEYEFESSAPTSFYHENGLIRFETVYPKNKIDTYTVVLCSSIGSFEFDPTQFSGIHGKVSFQDSNGQPITEKCRLYEGTVIQYTAVADQGYRHPNGRGEIKINASNPDKTINEIQNAIKFYPDKHVTVILPQPTGGRIEYTAGGKILEGKSCKLLSGTQITMRFYPWNRWQCNVQDGAKYIVTEQENQSVSLQGADINNGVFVENDNYKPTLNVVLKDTVQNVKFTISAVDIPPEEHTYKDGSKTTIIPDWLGKKDRLIFSQPVGTSEGIAIQMADDAILSGYAMKLDITMKGTKKGETEHFIRYIPKLPKVETIQIYGPGELAVTTKVYKEIMIQISKVEVTTHQVRTAENAKVTATFQDVSDPHELQNGEVLEASRDVTIMVKPDEGYYVTGSKVSQGAYRETMKYSRWEKDAEKILDKHPIQKIWYVTLDSSDPCGTCIYKLDGVAVSGRVGVQKGQKLTLDYTLKNSDYQIARNGLWGQAGNILHNETESCSIPVSEALDGTTVRRADYITVERKGD